MGGITDALTGAIGNAGVYAVLGLMLVDAVFPAGSEIVMLYAGALAAGAIAGHTVTLFGAEIDSTAWAYVVMALAGGLGYWVGSLLGWGIGRYGGHALVERHGRWFHLDRAKLARAESWFDRHGERAAFVGRNLPVVRSFISIPAGVFELPFARYALYSLIGSLPWAFGWAGAGLALGEGWERFHESSKWAGYVIAALIVLALAWLVLRSVRRRRARALAQADAREAPPV